MQVETLTSPKTSGKIQNGTISPAGEHQIGLELTNDRKGSNRNGASPDGKKGNQGPISALKKKPGPSILRKGKGNADDGPQRTDTNGVNITKGGKRHKIAFKDKIEDVITVENWKEYNTDNNTSSTCYCNIF